MQASVVAGVVPYDGHLRFHRDVTRRAVGQFVVVDPAFEGHPVGEVRRQAAAGRNGAVVEVQGIAGRGDQGDEGLLFSVTGARAVAGIRADIVRLRARQTGQLADKGAQPAALHRVGVVRGRTACEAPAHAARRHRIHTLVGDVAAALGSIVRDVGDRCCGHLSKGRQCRKGAFVAIGGAGVVHGIGAHMVGRAWREVGQHAGERPGSAAIRRVGVVGGGAAGGVPADAAACDASGPRDQHLATAIRRERRHVGDRCRRDSWQVGELADGVVHAIRERLPRHREHAAAIGAGEHAGVRKHPVVVHEQAKLRGVGDQGGDAAAVEPHGAVGNAPVLRPPAAVQAPVERGGAVREVPRQRPAVVAHEGKGRARHVCPRDGHDRGSERVRAINPHPAEVVPATNDMRAGPAGPPPVAGIHVVKIGIRASI